MTTHRQFQTDDREHRLLGNIPTGLLETPGEGGAVSPETTEGTIEGLEGAKKAAGKATEQAAADVEPLGDAVTKAEGTAKANKIDGRDLPTVPELRPPSGSDISLGDALESAGSTADTLSQRTEKARTIFGEINSIKNFEDAVAVIDKINASIASRPTADRREVAKSLLNGTFFTFASPGNYNFKLTISDAGLAIENLENAAVIKIKLGTPDKEVPAKSESKATEKAPEQTPEEKRYQEAREGARVARDGEKYAEATADAWTILPHGKSPFVYRRAQVQLSTGAQNVLLAYSPTGLQFMTGTDAKWQWVENMKEADKEAFKNYGDIAAKYKDVLATEEKKTGSPEIKAQNERNRAMEEECVRNAKTDPKWLADHTDAAFWEGNEEIYNTLAPAANLPLKVIPKKIEQVAQAAPKPEAQPTPKAEPKVKVPDVAPVEPTAGKKNEVKPDVKAPAEAAPVAEAKPEEPKAEEKPAEEKSEGVQKIEEALKKIEEKKEGIRQEIKKLTEQKDTLVSAYQEFIKKGLDYGIDHSDEGEKIDKDIVAVEKQIATKEQEAEDLDKAPEGLDAVLALAEQKLKRREELKADYEKIDAKDNKQRERAGEIQKEAGRIEKELKDIRTQLETFYGALDRSKDPGTEASRLKITATAKRIDVFVPRTATPAKVELAGTPAPSTEPEKKPEAKESKDEKLLAGLAKATELVNGSLTKNRLGNIKDVASTLAGAKNTLQLVLSRAAGDTGPLYAKDNQLYYRTADSLLGSDALAVDVQIGQNLYTQIIQDPQAVFKALEAFASTDSWMQARSKDKQFVQSVAKCLA